MESLRENKPLLWSIILSGLAIVGLLTGSSPEFSEKFGLVEIPMEVSRDRMECSTLADSSGVTAIETHTLELLQQGLSKGPEEVRCPLISMGVRPLTQLRHL